MHGRTLGGLLLAAAAIAPLGAQAPRGRAGADSSKNTLPLEPGRHIQFTTTSGSWMSVDVSPDGKTLVFDLLGDLYTMPVTGGSATRLTSGLAFDAQPTFSPDGKHIVFVSDRTGGENLFTMSLDGKDTVQLTKGNDRLYMSPTFTPDGEYVVASRSGGLGGAAKLWMYNVHGGTGQELGAAAGPPSPDGPAGAANTTKFSGAAFGKDPRYLWFAARTGDWQYNAILPQYQLGIYDRETGTRTVMSDRVGSAFRPELSPDGKWLVYGSRYKAQTGLRLRNLASGEERWLRYPVQRDDQESRATLDVLPGYSFTPDSKALIASYDGGFWRIPIAEGEQPAAIPFRADVALDIGPEVRFAYTVDDGATFTAHQIRDLALSPDGTRLAFTTLDRVYVQTLPDGAPKRVDNLDVNEHFPIWSPDGKSIAFVTWDDNAGGDIYRTTVDGRGTPQRLTRVAALYTRPAWSPDGRRIVAVRAAARDQQEAFGGFPSLLGAQFVWVPSAGGDATVIAPTAGRSWPHFTRDTARIYAYNPREGLVSFRWDGTDVKTLVKVTGQLPPGSTVDDAGLRDGATPREPTFLGDDERELEQNPTPPPASWMEMAPQGDKALALVGSDLYLITVPEVGGATPTISVANPEAASFPVKKLTDVGAQFPTWSRDARTVHWAMGNVHFSYDIARARVIEDSLRAAARAKADSARAMAAKGDSAAMKNAAAEAARGDSAKKKEKPGYEPAERKVAISIARSLARGTAVLRGARVITMKGNDVIEDADIVVRDDRIVAVGKRGTVDLPAGARVLDMTGKTITPGFVDTHYHTQWLVPEIHTSEVWQYLATLAYGTTTTRDPQTSTTDVLTYGDKVESGDLVGPRIFSTGPGVFVGENIRSLEHARSILARYAKYYDTKTLKMYMTGNRQQRQWVIMAAKEEGLMPTTEGGLDFNLDLTHAMDGYPGIEHALPIEPLYDDVVQLFKGTQVTHTPTLLVSYGGPFGENYFYTFESPDTNAKLRHFTPELALDGKVRRRGQGAGGSPGPGGWFMKDEYIFPQHAAFAKHLLDAGGRVGIGSHGQLQGLGYHWELWAMSTGGMSNHDVLRTATILGAQAIGMGGDVGSIEAGKLADMVIMDRNPLDDIRNTNTIRYVMKGGRLYDGNTLDEVYPVARKLPAFAWQHMGPGGNFGVLQAGETKKDAKQR